MILVCKGEGCRALELDYVLCVSNYFISLRITRDPQKRKNRVDTVYIFYFSLCIFLSNFSQGFVRHLA